MTAPRDAQGAARLASTADVRRIDASAEEVGDGGLAALMARAGAAVTRSALRRFRARPGVAWVLAGPGMNGGDGSVAARLLAASGRRTRLAVLSPPRAGSLAAQALADWRKIGGETLDLTEPGALQTLAAALKPDRADAPAFLIDALFGVGLTRPLEGRAADVVAWANAASAPTLAVDIPSGVAADTGRALGPAIAAWATVSFIAPKRGVYLSDGARLSGALEVVDIEPPAEALREWPDQVSAIDAPTRMAAAPVKSVDAHKYRHGSVLVASGGRGASGAARLAARAALRSGAGLVTIAAPAEAMAECAAHATAVMLTQVDDAAGLSVALKDARLNAVLIGPGHARPLRSRGGDATAAAVCAVCETQPFLAGARALVLDADALTVWPDPSALFERLVGGAAVLTPHGGEFAGLFPDLHARLHDPAEAATFGKIEATRVAAARSGAVVLFKGPDTVVAAPDGRVGVQRARGARAAPGLATAGAGDVLAGVITGLIARGARPFEAACLGASIHVEASRRAGRGQIAEDLVEALRAPVLP